MPAYTVEKSITINKPVEHVLNYVKHFRNWTKWSPWLVTEPESSITFAGKHGDVGSSYAWQGKRLGKGKLEITHITDSSIECDMTIVKPFKSKSQVVFKFEPTGEFTKITWFMHSKLPFYLSFMKKQLVGLIGMDYDRGLRMLKSQMETSQVLSSLELIGERDLQTIHYVGLPCKATIATMGDVWESEILKIQALLKEQNVVAGTPFGLYESMDVATTRTKFSICIPVDKNTLDKILDKKITLKKPLVAGSIDACSTFVVEHTGAYDYIGNAWAMAYSAARAKNYKTKKQPIGLEIYLNDPATTEKVALKTEVLLFAK